MNFRDCQWLSANIDLLYKLEYNYPTVKAFSSLSKNKNLKTTVDKKTQEKIRWLASFPELNPNPIIEVHSRGKIFYTNPTAKKLFPDLESLGNKHPYLANLHSLFTKLKNIKNKQISREIKSDNVWFNQVINYITDTKSIRIYGFDISYRKKMEEELNKSEQQRDETIRITGAGYYEHTVDSSSGLVSDRFAEILGFKHEELPKYPEFAKWLSKRIHKDDLKDFKTRVHDFHEGKIVRFDHEYRVLAKNGEWLWLHFISTLLQKNTQGLPLYVAGLVFDVTERKNLDQHKDDFINIAGHELRTPVSAINLMNQILQEMLADNPQALKYLKKIEHQSNIQKNLINDLLNVSRIQTNKLELIKEQFELQNLIEDTVEIMQKTTQKHKFVIKGKTHSKIFADKNKIEQVLVNFCSNAIKFSPKGGKIIAKIRENKKEIIVGITDFGIGIPKKHYHGIFKRLYRVYGSGNKTYPGLGMGLYISYQIIKLQDGNMWFESKSGKGSTFYFSLPKQTK